MPMPKHGVGAVDRLVVSSHASPDRSKIWPEEEQVSP